MKLYNPTKVYFENECLAKYGHEIAGKRVLILTGRASSKRNHSLQDVVDNLDVGAEVALFDEVESDPSIETVVRAARENRGFAPDVCIGIGGGSAIDAAKAVAVLLANDEGADVEHLFYAERNAAYLPVMAVPTTCGTGSEATPFSVLTDAAQGTKRTLLTWVYPQISFVDYKYLRTIPYRECVSTCLDALSHLVESYLSAWSTEYNRFYSTEGLRLFGEYKGFIAGPERFEAVDDAIREKMMAASMFGGFAITANGSSLPHGLARTITHAMGISHGRSVTMFLPGYLRSFEEQEGVGAVLRLLGFESIDELEDYLYAIVGCVRVPEGAWRDSMRQMLANTRKLSTFPYDATEDVFMRYEGKLFQIDREA